MYVFYIQSVLTYKQLHSWPEVIKLLTTSKNLGSDLSNCLCADDVAEMLNSITSNCYVASKAEKGGTFLTPA